MGDQKKFEELAEILSLKLAAKLKSGEITPEQMAISIEKFLIAANSRNKEELIKTVENL